MKISEIILWLLVMMIIILKVNHLIHWLWMFIGFVVIANFYLIFTKKLYTNTAIKLNLSTDNQNIFFFNVISIFSGISYSSVIIFLLFFLLSWPGTIAIGFLSLLISLAVFITILAKRRQISQYQSFIVRGSLFLILCLCFIIIEFYQAIL